MTLVITHAASQLQWANTVRTGALVLLLIAGGVSGLFLLYNSLYRHPQQRRALGTVRLRLPIVSSASARQRTPWKKFLFVGIGLILGVLVFLPINHDHTIPERLGVPCFYVWMSCNLAQQFGRRDQQRWLAVFGSFCFCVVAVGAFAGAISGRWSEWTTANHTVEVLFAYGMATFLCVFSVMGVVHAMTVRTLVTDDGIDFGAHILRWNDLKRYEWYDDGDDSVVVVAMPSPGSALFQLVPLPKKTASRFRDCREVEFMIPVPSELREQFQEILTSKTEQTTN
jgi:hypothetical protein